MSGHSTILRHGYKTFERKYIFFVCLKYLCSNLFIESIFNQEKTLSEITILFY